MKPIVRNKKTDDLYEYQGENVFTNLKTGISGKVSDEAAKKTFVINLEATSIINEYPMIKELIKKLSLSLIK